MGADLVASVTAGAAPETGDLCGYAVTRAGRDHPRGARRARGGGPAQWLPTLSRQNPNRNPDLQFLGGAEGI
jgi:hypothetical protein